jgi:nucleotide-binding universal stress UspA family protein
VRVSRTSGRDGTDAPATCSGNSSGVSTILVATDGSEPARRAVAVALELARETGDDVCFVTVWRELHGDFGLPYAKLIAPDIADIERDWAGETLAAAAAEAEAAGVQTETVARHGPAAAEICAVAVERSVRMIVVGSSGWGPIEGMLLGSVSSEVLRRSPCPVLVVPRSA